LDTLETRAPFLINFSLEMLAKKAGGLIFMHFILVGVLSQGGQAGGLEIE